MNLCDKCGSVVVESGLHKSLIEAYGSCLTGVYSDGACEWCCSFGRIAPYNVNQKTAKYVLVSKRPYPPSKESPPKSSVYPESAASPNTIWRHRKGGLYICLGIAPDSTNGAPEIGSPGEARYVVYWSLKYRAMRVRKASEFLDGRFMPVYHSDDEETSAPGEIKLPF